MRAIKGVGMTISALDSNSAKVDTRSANNARAQSEAGFREGHYMQEQLTLLHDALDWKVCLVDVIVQ